MSWFYKLKSILQNTNRYPTYLLITPLEVVLRAPWAVLPWVVFLLRALISSQRGLWEMVPPQVSRAACVWPFALPHPPLWTLASSASPLSSTASAWSPLPDSWACPHSLQEHSPELPCWFLDFGQHLTCLKLESKSSTWCTICFFWC